MRRLARIFSRSLTARLVISFLGFSLVTVALVATIAFVRARSALKEQIVARITAMAASREDQLDRWVREQRLETIFLSHLHFLRGRLSVLTGPSSDPAFDQVSREVTELLDDAISHEPDFLEVSVLAIRDGRVRASTDSQRIGDSRSAERYFLEGRRRAYIQSVHPSLASGKPELTVATPLVSPSGDTLAVLAAHLDLEQIDRVIADRRGLGQSGEAYLVDEHSGFVSAARFGRDRWQRGVSSEGIRAAVTDHRGGVGQYRNYAGIRVIGAYQWSGAQRLAVLVEVPESEAFASARRLALVISLVGAVSALLLAGATWLVARRIARPVLQVADAAERVAGGDFTVTAPVVTRDEIGRLATAFNGMTRRLARLHATRDRQMKKVEEAARALAQSQELLQAILDSTPSYVMVATLDHRIVLANCTLVDRFPPKEGESMNGRVVAELLGPEAAGRLAAQAREALEAGGPVEREHVLGHGSERSDLQCVVFPLYDTQRMPYAIATIANDVTARKRAEEEHRLFAERLQHTQKLESLGVLAGGIAHDFNNLLTAILGHADIALSELPASSPLRDDVERIVRAATRATEMTNQMLAYAGRGRFVVRAVCLNRLVVEISELLKVSIPKKVELRYDLTDGLGAVQGDPAQLQQVVMNLITNAAEAIVGKTGTITLETREQVVAGGEEIPGVVGEPLAAGRYVRLTVRDTGCGMDPATRPRIFEPFFTTKFTGRGLGLAAVLGIVRAHRGGLALKSSPAEGTEFSVFLPVAFRDAPTVQEPVRLPPAARAQGTVLVVDDEEHVRGLARRALERAGYQVLLAGDGAEGVKVFQEVGESVDVVLLDVTMPVMDGRQALEAIREIDPGVRIVLSSGFTEHDLSARGETDGVRFLQKPYLSGRLLEVVAEAAAAVR
ncbi:MAG: hybrid sensor histidine kinase/response regulator [Gemmatimonadales bacterium]